ncbi:MAG TPA: T9SS type A sorting domain-containing protein, partial [Chitinophagales bacterium]|nr:T9SS type A sorting domain-containing protein [Chitinophagales bacterium]
NANGTITGNGSGGTPPLQYSIDGITFQASGTFNGVAAGIYTITVKDNNGCITTKLVDVANVAGPSTLTATIVAATCGNGNGKITAAASGGTGSFTYSLDGTIFQAGSSFTSLAAGTYTLWVKDGNGCTKNLSVTVPNLEGPLLTLSASPSTCYSNDGTITATATGGTVAITYSNNGGAFQSSNIFTGLAAGFYTVTAKDANGCLSTTAITVGAIAGPTVTAVASSSGCGDGTITANASGGTPAYEYSLDGINFQSSNVFTCLAQGTYTVTVKDANDCVSTITVDVTVVLPISLLYFNAHPVQDIVALNWSTDSEFNNDFFTVEKLNTENVFEPIATVDAAGNSSIQLFYSAFDRHPLPGINYYRLKQTDFNGNSAYSNVVSAETDAESFFNVYPNPAGEFVTILTDQVFQSFRISDVTGRTMIELKGNFTNETVLRLDGLASGCYTLHAIAGNGTGRSVVLIKNVNDIR